MRGLLRRVPAEPSSQQAPSAGRESALPSCARPLRGPERDCPGSPSTPAPARRRTVLGDRFAVAVGSPGRSMLPYCHREEPGGARRRGDPWQRWSALPIAPSRCPIVMGLLRRFAPRNDKVGGRSAGHCSGERFWRGGVPSLRPWGAFARDAVRQREAKLPCLTALRSGPGGSSLGTPFHHGRRSRPVSRRLLNPPPPAARPFLGTPSPPRWEARVVACSLIVIARSRAEPGDVAIPDSVGARHPLLRHGVRS